MYHLTPINKTAALATAQSGCASDGTLSKEQERENLVAAWKDNEVKICSSKKGSRERAALCVKKVAIEKKMSEIRKKRRAPGVENFFISAARESLTKPQFNSVMTKAVAMLRAAQEAAEQSQ